MIFEEAQAYEGAMENLGQNQNTNVDTTLLADQS